MVTTKPIKVDDEVKETLDGKKVHKRETYNDVLRRILKLNGVKQKNEDTTNL
jgi:negative regulator of replication initiation